MWHTGNHLAYLKMFLASGEYWSFSKHTEIFRICWSYETWHKHVIQKWQMCDFFWAASPLCQLTV